MENFQKYDTNRLRFEYEKRQREIGTLQSELSDLRRQEAQINEDWEAAASQLENGADYRNFDAGGYQSGLAHVSDQIGDVSRQVTSLREELSAIDAILRTR